MTYCDSTNPDKIKCNNGVLIQSCVNGTEWKEKKKKQQKSFFIFLSFYHDFPWDDFNNWIAFFCCEVNLTMLLDFKQNVDQSINVRLTKIERIRYLRSKNQKYRFLKCVDQTMIKWYSVVKEVECLFDYNLAMQFLKEGCVLTCWIFSKAIECTNHVQHTWQSWKDFISLFMHIM